MFDVLLQDVTATQAPPLYEPVNLKILRNAPFFQNGAKSGFEMCSGPSTSGAGAKTRPESRIKEFTPHCVCRPGVLGGVLRDNTGTAPGSPHAPKAVAVHHITVGAYGYFLFSYHISVYIR